MKKKTTLTQLFARTPEPVSQYYMAKQPEVSNLISQAAVGRASTKLASVKILSGNIKLSGLKHNNQSLSEPVMPTPNLKNYMQPSTSGPPKPKKLNLSNKLLPLADDALMGAAKLF